MKRPKLPKSQAGIRLYTSAEIYLDQLPTGEKVATMRFHTVQDVKRGMVPDGTTPWIMFSLEMFDGLSTQMATIAAAGRRWNPDDDTSLPDVGNAEGITSMKVDGHE